MNKADAKIYVTSSRGFTLLEVVITIGILLTMMIAITTMLRGSFDIRFALSQEGQVTHRLNTAMEKISSDLAHAYILSSKDVNRNPSDRYFKTIFKIDKSFSGDKLAFTTMNHQPLRANAKESDSSYVVYEIQDSKKIPGRKNLYRGAFVRIPADFKDDPPMNLLAKNIKTIVFEAWQGDGWSKDKWNSESRETRDKIPHMVRVSIEAWSEDLEEGETPGPAHEATLKYQTIIYLTSASKFDELKQKSKNLKL
ncbi:MAG: type II secretion system protein [Bdellovibrionota bacterium]